MQRRDIDEIGFAILETELTDKLILPGEIAVIRGQHPEHGHVMLIQAGGLYLALADDVSAIVGRNDSIEGDA